MNKREKNQHTVKAQRVLKTIRGQIHDLLGKLSAPTPPSNDSLLQMESEISRMRSAIEMITRDTQSLNQTKHDVSDELQRLESRILEWRVIVPVPVEGPLPYSNGKPSSLCWLSRNLQIPHRSPMGSPYQPFQSNRSGGDLHWRRL